jgi:hypothetical protein
MTKDWSYVDEGELDSCPLTTRVRVDSLDPRAGLAERHHGDGSSFAAGLHRS